MNLDLDKKDMTKILLRTAHTRYLINDTHVKKFGKSWTCWMITIMVVELKIRKRMRKNWKKSWTYWVITTIVMEVKVREGMK